MKIHSEEILAKGFGTTKKVTFEYRAADGTDVSRVVEVYERGDAAAVLPIDVARNKLLLTRQMRLPAWINGQHESLLEVCAGRLDGDDPRTCILREALEEMGFRLRDLRKVCEAYASPGYSTEKVTYFVAAYSPADKVAQGGGLKEEGEHIEVVELAFDEAFAMIASGKVIDAKTILLLQYLKLCLTSRQLDQS
jgi:nudix-type nucleoside diphosphatase (YffH/AdpP family)